MKTQNWVGGKVGDLGVVNRDPSPPPLPSPPDHPSPVTPLLYPDTLPPSPLDPGPSPSPLLPLLHPFTFGLQPGPMSVLFV